jgi:hypothetical protein
MTTSTTPTTLGLIIASLAFFVSACGSPMAPACTPNETRACTCTDGRSGTQVCNGLGTGLSSCVCGGGGGGPTGCETVQCGPSTLNPAVNCGTCAAGMTCSNGLCVTARNCSGRVCGPDGAGGSCGNCPSGTACTASGQCMSTGPGNCAPGNPMGACPAGQQCLNGACCAQPCGSSCCNDSAVCVRDSAGNMACANRCTTTSQCPTMSGRRCCSALVGPDGRTLDYGACIGGTEAESLCRCTVASDCASGSCAPALTRDNIPVGPYICKAPACAPYQRCTGLGSCPNGYCSMCDSRDNCFCAQQCTSAAMCGGTRCTTLARSNGACSNSQTVCVP